MLIREVALAHVLSILSFHTSRRREKPLRSKLRRGSFLNPQTLTKLDGRFAFPSRTVKKIDNLSLAKRGRAHVCRIHVSINRAGLDVVNGDAARAEVSGKSLRETRDRALGERRDRTAAEWHALAVGTANVNDTP